VVSTAWRELAQSGVFHRQMRDVASLIDSRELGISLLKAGGLQAKALEQTE
jgi:hypothetical protein